jgi:proteasome lid subunit RPN8/RPN11
MVGEITRVVPATNGFDGARRRRFEIAPEEVMDLERRLEGTAHGIVVFYPSQPYSPARPSEFDREHAWPWYTYSVNQVTADHGGPSEAFEHRPELREFEQVEILCAPARPKYGQLKP